MHSNNIKYLFILIIVAGLLILYKIFDPATHPFPKCPFKQLTGLQCPGCGSQRAVHHILNLKIRKAYFLNPLLVISIPYIILGLLFDWLPLNNFWLRQRKLLFGSTAIKFILIVVIVFWIARNIPCKLA